MALTRGKKLIAIAVALIVIITVLGYAIAVYRRSEGVIAPDFTLTDVDNNTFNITDFRGKVVILDFMATWCGPCKELINTLKSIHETYPEVVIISIDIDITESNQELKDFKETYDADWIFALDTITEQVSAKYGVLGIPKTVIINPKGEVAFEHSGKISYEELSQEIDRAKSGGVAGLMFFNLGLPMIAFLAGILSFFSPCSFPLLPSYIAYYVGRDKEGGSGVKKGFLHGMQPALGIIAFYSLIGIACVLAGELVKPYVPMLELFVGIIIIILGVVLLLHLPILTKSSSKFVGRISGVAQRSRKIGLFLYGIIYGAASAGCTAPVFIMIIIAAIAGGNFLQGAFIIVLYALGMALLMVIVTILVATAKNAVIGKLKKVPRYVNPVCGTILIAVGIYLIYYYFSVWW